MRGGRIAIKGFDYQTIVILDQLFDHFDQYPHHARARPEGEDDLDLFWLENGRDQSRYVQVKKPRETDDGTLKHQPWQLSEIANELLPNTLCRLVAPDRRQVWILGDPVLPEVRRLVKAGNSAADREAEFYWSVVHIMARAAVAAQFPVSQRRALFDWRFQDLPFNAADARDILIDKYGRRLSTANAGDEIVRRYQERVVWINRHLPDILARTEILDNYGSEEVVGQRFKDRLQREYRLSPEVVEHNLFGNFRSFINDVAKRPGAMIDRLTFEVQLRSAWPQMSAATEPPIPPADGILRPDLIDGLVKPEAAKVIEVVGISGSGKTTLASQAAVALKDHDPSRLPVYVRVRSDAVFRDVMSGVSFYLLRRGIPDLFGLAVESKPADETVIDRLAELCSSLPQPVQLFLDLVEGTCNAQFGRELSRFVTALTPGACRLVVFGQQSTFSAMSAVETESAGILAINMRGFRWGEFSNLVGHYHPSINTSLLWEIFNRVTVGRPAGLYAKLAEALARQPSLEAMLAVASRPPEDMVSAAEQNRFNQLAPALRSAAERLVCFALPFRREDAEAAFPDENVVAAITVLVDLGLLRIEAEGLLEMHETVRAGLESGTATSVRLSAHRALAEWYGTQGDIAAQIFHLDKAGRPVEADRLAKDTFLRGESWRSLASYVTGRSLVTAREVANLAARAEPIADFYLLRSIQSELASEGMDGYLMDLMTAHHARFFIDPVWARPMVEAILALNPGRFQELLEFAVVRAANANERRQGLTWLLIAVRFLRRDPAIEIVDFTKSQPDDVQRQLLPFLFVDGGRVALRLAFEIFARPTDDSVRRDTSWNGVKLKVERREDTVEILAALPAATASSMIATRSLAFGSIGSLLWAVRHQLRVFCVDILATNDVEAEIKIGAWRVSIFIGHPQLEGLVDPLSPDTFPQEYALLGPILAPAAYDPGRYESILFDQSSPPSRRGAALAVLLSLDIDLGALRSRLATLQDDSLVTIHENLLLMMFAKKPFASGVPILQAELASPSAAALSVPQLVSSLAAVAEYPWPGITDLLMQGLKHNDRWIRSAAAVGLARRRSRRAKEFLASRIAVESDAAVVALLAQALGASGPQAADDFTGAPTSTGVTLWQCIVAMRTRDEGFASQLVALATDTSVHWMVRREAIWAAGHLPFAAALQTIAPVVLVESTPLTLDHDEDLQVHASLSGLLQAGVSAFLSDGEASFIQFIGSILEQQWSSLFSRSSLPLPSEPAQWLYTSLIADPSPAGIQRLANQIRTPLLQAAVVRAFRLCGRAQSIEDVLACTSSVWLAIKCLQEMRWMRDPDPKLCPRLRHVLTTSPCAHAARLGRIIDEIEGGRRQAVSATSPPVVLQPAEPVRLPNPPLDFTTAVRALRGATDLGIDLEQPIALSRLDREEVQRLIVLADPANDLPRGIVGFTPAIAFTPEGHSVGREISRSTGGTSISERLRLAIAAANRFELPMPWHVERLQWPLIESYGPQFIASLGLQGEAERVYQALESDGDILLPYLGRPEGIKATKFLIDDRLVPILHRFLSIGDDAFFESLCNLTLRISSLAVVQLLSGLLRRWVSRFDVTSSAPQAENIELWRGFARLNEHPRFGDVPGWRKTLENVLASNIAWYHRRDIVRVLERDPGSYVLVESALSKEENWAHFSLCEIDRLDQAAERLFREVH